MFSSISVYKFFVHAEGSVAGRQAELQLTSSFYGFDDKLCSGLAKRPIVRCDEDAHFESSGFRLVEHLADLERQRVRSKRFLDEVQTWRQEPSLTDFIGIAGH